MTLEKPVRCASFVGLAAGLVASSATAAPVNLAVFDFESGVTTDATQTARVISVDGVAGAGVDPVQMTFGAGFADEVDSPSLTAGNGGGNALLVNINDTFQTTVGGSLTAQEFLGFTLTATNPGEVLDLDTLTFDLRNQGGGAGIDELALFSSVDGFASAAAAVDTLATTAAQPGVFASQSFDVSGSDFDSLSSVTFRIYINDNGGFSNSAGANLDNLVVTGEVVPEPASLMLAAGGVLLIGLRRRSA